MIFSTRGTRIGLALASLFSSANAELSATFPNIYHCEGNGCTDFIGSADSLSQIGSLTKELIVEHLISEESSRLLTAFIHDDEIIAALKNYKKIFTPKAVEALMKTMASNPGSQQELDARMRECPELLEFNGGISHITEALGNFIRSYSSNKSSPFSSIFSVVLLRLVGDVPFFIPRASLEHGDAAGMERLSGLLEGASSPELVGKVFGFTPREMEIGNSIFERRSEMELPLFELFKRLSLAAGASSAEEFDSAIDAAIGMFRLSYPEVSAGN